MSGDNYGQVINESGSGCAGTFIAIILGACVLLFGVLVIVPGINEWQAGNAQVASINASRDAQIAQMQAERDLAIARAQAQRDIEIAQQQAQADVSLAAIDLAGKSTQSAWQTLQLVIIGVFGVVCFATAGGVMVWFVLYLRREALI